MSGTPPVAGPGASALAALRRATSVFGSVVVVVMMLYIVANALSRTVFTYSLPAALEIVQFLLMPGLVSIGFVAATLADRHVVADLLYGRFPPAGRRAVIVAAHLLGVLVLGVLAWFSFDHALYAFDRGFRAGYTEVPSWPVYFFVPVAFGLSVLMLLGKAWTAARRPAEEFTGEPDELIGEDIEQALRREGV